MSVVSVTSTDEDNAAAVFETLNDRGIGLSTPDLLRNLLLRRAADATSRQRIVSAWQTILGIDEEASVDEFLRHYWVSQRGDVKARKLYREIKSKVVSEGIDSLELSDALAKTAPIYRDIVLARDDDPEMQRLLRGIRALNAKALYPPLLSGYAVVGSGDKRPLRQLGQALIAVFVRYNVIGGRETTVMESRLYEVAAKLRADGDFDAAGNSLAELTPDATDFIRRFERATIGRAATARYLLAELEHAKRGTGELAIEGPDRVHLEHIYPQTPDTKWPNHSAMINRLGNLTLLSGRLNSSVRNAEFSKKKADAYAGSDITMTQELLGYDVWDTKAIEARQTALSDLVFPIWSFPGESAPPPREAATDGGDAEAVTAGEEASIDALPEVPED